MALTKKSESQAVYLQAKHFCWWQEIKSHVDGCMSVEVTNPTNKQVLTKYGYAYDRVEGLATKVEKYDRTHSGKRYFGFKLTLVDGQDTYVLDMPYHSQLLRRFLKIARNVNWLVPLSIKVFKGKGKDDREELGVWFQQQDQTVKSYYTKEEPHGMPAPKYYESEQTWDFRDQHSWLIERMKTETIPDIEAAAKRVAPPIQPAPLAMDRAEAQEQPDHDEPPAVDFQGITDDDIPF